MPAAAVASRTPAIAGMSGMIFGARGEILTAIFRHPAVRAEGASRRMTVLAWCYPVDYFFAGAAGLSADGSAAAGGGLSGRSIVADLRKFSTSSACALW